MKNEEQGLFPIGLRPVMEVVLYVFIFFQFVWLIWTMRLIYQKHPLGIDIAMLPVAYLGPLIISVRLKRCFKQAFEGGELSVEWFLLYNDWLNVMLMVVYVFILQFARLR